MKRMFLVVGAAVVILPWLGAARAEAEVIPWTESVTLVGPNLSADGSAHIFSQNLGSNAQIVLSPGPTTSGITSNFGLVDLVNINASPASTGAVGLFGGPSGNYSLSLTLHDSASGASGSLTFGGNFSGSIAQGNGVESISNQFTSPTTQTLKLGGNLYTVSNVSFTPNSLGQPTITNGTGHIFAFSITAEKLGVAPEPSSLVLACLGLPSLGLARWFRRRNTRNA
jgi:hypothetical protein